MGYESAKTINERRPSENSANALNSARSHTQMRDLARVGSITTDLVYEVVTNRAVPS